MIWLRLETIGSKAKVITFIQEVKDFMSPMLSPYKKKSP